MEEFYIYCISDPQEICATVALFSNLEDASEFQQSYWNNKDKSMEGVSPEWWRLIRPKITRYHVNCACKKRFEYGELIDDGQSLLLPSQKEVDANIVDG